MKIKFLTIVFLSAFALLQSCGDDSKDPDYETQFVGRWKFTSKVYFGCTDAASNKTYECGANDAYGFCTNDVIFKANGDYYWEIDQVQAAGTWGANKTMLGFYDDFNYTLSGNTLTIETINADVSNGCKQRITLTKVL